jgi:alkaline phosphatase
MTNKISVYLTIATFWAVGIVSCKALETDHRVSGGSTEAQTPQNIILLIGDGMGFSQVTAAEYEFGELVMTSLPYHGMTSTYSSDAKVTDSASSATAFATGHKTNNGMLGQLPDGTPVRSIAQYANELGKATALLATSQITHATPAAFAVHHNDRGEQFTIAEKFVDSGIDMIMGAGWDWFLPESEGGKREDEQNLITEMKEMGYVYIDRDEDLNRMQGEEKVLVFLEGGSMPPAPERGNRFVNLTKAALAELSQQNNGFFLLIEGSQIDWAGHQNDEEWLLAEMADFDAVIAEVLDFAEKDGNTLVVVTADHETGGLTLPSADEGELRHMFSTGGHTAQHVPVFSYGPQAERFEGRYDNTDTAKKIFSIWGSEMDD